MSSAVSVTPIEQKVAALDPKEAERQLPADKAYTLKFACASLSSMAASGVTNPFDIIKVRQQLRTQIPGERANAFWAIGAQMVRNEGLSSLAHGFTASMMREFVYSGFRLGTYELFKDTLHTVSNGSLTREGVSLKVLAAVCSASIGSLLANPTDVIKVRMQAEYPQGRPYRNTPHAFVSVFHEGAHSATTLKRSPLVGGIRALWRGGEATTFRGVVLTISQIASYDHIKQVFKSKRWMEEGVPLHITASFLAGLCCSLTSSPIDVVKVRLMTDKHRQFSGMVHCARQVLTHEGPMAFYKGFGMCWARLGTHTMVSLLIFEELRKLFGVEPL
ncbi:mitochondrial carrier [Irpex rosettiformis]|uniref:Mitochondrial carrier n=1 Tax=Irpex rosettiformis TaxID=378272 RepID=A0ACB8UGA7_9APHY|nr:mitochondrial carrier [Irpex rosettiformis]